jgi:glycosyltransferase involved in cell wall biosynthesis
LRGIPEVIVNNKTGMLFPVGDFKELANKLETLLTNDGLRQEMGAKSRQHKIDNFLMQDKINTLINYYISAK